jgi:hypothetical protein
VRLPREGLWFESGGHVVEFVGDSDVSVATNRGAYFWCPECERNALCWRAELTPLTPAARELLQLDWSAL